MKLAQTVQAFEDNFQKAPEVVIKSPGRINIIGEHTDYNDGFVLPAAIDYHIFLCLSPNNTNNVAIYSTDYDEMVNLSLDKIERGENDWLNLLNGVIFQLKEKIAGFDLAFGGNVPEGAGVSSSFTLKYCFQSKNKVFSPK